MARAVRAGGNPQAYSRQAARGRGGRALQAGDEGSALQADDDGLLVGFTAGVHRGGSRRDANLGASRERAQGEDRMSTSG